MMKAVIYPGDVEREGLKSKTSTVLAEKGERERMPVCTCIHDIIQCV